MVLVFISMGAQALSERHHKRKASRQSLSPKEIEQATIQPQPQPQPQIPNPTPTIQRTRNPAKRLFSKTNNRKSIAGALSTTTTTVTSITPFIIQNITPHVNQNHHIHKIQPPQYASSEYSNTTTLSPYSSTTPSISLNYLPNTSENMPFSPDDVGRKRTPVIFSWDVADTTVSELEVNTIASFGTEFPAPRHICAWSPEYATEFLWPENEGQFESEEEEGEGEQWDKFVEGGIVQECVVRPLVPRRSSPRLRTMPV